MSERSMVYRRKCRLQKLVREHVMTVSEAEQLLDSYTQRRNELRATEEFLTRYEFTRKTSFADQRQISASVASTASSK